jgi:hypothetical protein
MGVNSIASERKPSMLRIRARAGRGSGVAVGSWATTGVMVSVGGWNGVGVEVKTGTVVGVGSGVGTTGKQEVRSRSVRRKVRVRFITILSIDFYFIQSTL